MCRIKNIDLIYFLQIDQINLNKYVFQGIYLSAPFFTYAAAPIYPCSPSAIRVRRKNIKK